MRIIRDLDIDGRRVGPSDTLSVALRLMREHASRAVAVVDEGRFVGVVSYVRAQEGAPDERVREVMTPVPVSLDENATVRYAAKALMDSGQEHVPVLREGEYVGLLSSLSLLGEIGRSWDPLTGLSWSDRLRDWGIRTLASGREISVVFFDLNDFGDYNKRHGHLVGDRVIKAFATQLSRAIDRDHDVLVRYGGDEFVVGTDRPRAEVEGLVADLKSRALHVEGVAEPVQFTVGISGGKRTREREKVHYAATVDNLINLASKHCLANKAKGTIEPAPTVEPATPPEAAVVAEVPVVEAVVTEPPTEVVPRFTVVETPTEPRATVQIDAGDPEAPVAVTVVFGDAGETGVSLRAGASMLESVARATARAIERLHPGVQLVIDDTMVHMRQSGGRLVTVMGRCRRGDAQAPIFMTGDAAGDVYQSVADTIVRAFTESDPSRQGHRNGKGRGTSNG